MKSAKIDGRVIRVGDTITSNEKAGSLGLPPGRKVGIVAINKGAGKGKFTIGIANKDFIEGWHSLEGLLRTGSGYWLDGDQLFKYFKADRLSESVIIKGDFSFRKKDLKGKKGTLLATLPDCDESMVEFEEFVEGCSCDGLGKAGHCLVVSHDLLEFVDIEKGK